MDHGLQQQAQQQQPQSPDQDQTLSPRRSQRLSPQGTMLSGAAVAAATTAVVQEGNSAPSGSAAGEQQQPGMEQQPQQTGEQGQQADEQQQQQADKEQQQRTAEEEEAERAAAAAAAAEERQQEEAVLAEAKRIRDVLNAVKVSTKRGWLPACLSMEVTLLPCAAEALRLRGRLLLLLRWVPQPVQAEQKQTHACSQHIDPLVWLVCGCCPPWSKPAMVSHSR